MSLMKKRLAVTDERLVALKEARKLADKARRKAVKESRADRERKLRLVGEAVLHRVERGDWNEADFQSMMGSDRQPSPDSDPDLRPARRVGLSPVFVDRAVDNTGFFAVTD